MRPAPGAVALKGSTLVGQSAKGHLRPTEWLGLGVQPPPQPLQGGSRVYAGGGGGGDSGYNP